MHGVVRRGRRGRPERSKRRRQCEKRKREEGRPRTTTLHVLSREGGAGRGPQVAVDAEVAPSPHGLGSLRARVASFVVSGLVFVWPHTRLGLEQKQEPAAAGGGELPAAGGERRAAERAEVDPRSALCVARSPPCAWFPCAGVARRAQRSAHGAPCARAAAYPCSSPRSRLCAVRCAHRGQGRRCSSAPETPPSAHGRSHCAQASVETVLASPGPAAGSPAKGWCLSL